MSPKATPWSPVVEATSPSTFVRHATAGVLRSASAVLARLARRLTSSTAQRRSDTRLEFYAESGAPEGALYLDGQLIGWLPGVTRL